MSTRCSSSANFGLIIHIGYSVILMLTIKYKDQIKKHNSIKPFCSKYCNILQMHRLFSDITEWELMLTHKHDKINIHKEMEGKKGIPFRLKESKFVASGHCYCLVYFKHFAHETQNFVKEPFPYLCILQDQNRRFLVHNDRTVSLQHLVYTDTLLPKKCRVH